MADNSLLFSKASSGLIRPWLLCLRWKYLIACTAETNLPIELSSFSRSHRSFIEVLVRGTSLHLAYIQLSIPVIICFALMFIKPINWVLCNWVTNWQHWTQHWTNWKPTIKTDLDATVCRTKLILRASHTARFLQRAFILRALWSRVNPLCRVAKRDDKVYSCYSLGNKAKRNSADRHAVNVLSFISEQMIGYITFETRSLPEFL